jgi:hypothetical protein
MEHIWYGTAMKGENLPAGFEKPLGSMPAFAINL